MVAREMVKDSLSFSLIYTRRTRRYRDLPNVSHAIVAQFSLINHFI